MHRCTNTCATPLLATWLAEGNSPAYPWLELAGKYGLEEIAQVCINHIIEKRCVPYPQVNLQQHHMIALIAGLAKALPAMNQAPPVGALLPVQLSWAHTSGVGLEAYLECPSCSNRWKLRRAVMPNLSPGQRVVEMCQRCGKGVYVLPVWPGARALAGHSHSAPQSAALPLSSSVEAYCLQGIQYIGSPRASLLGYQQGSTHGNWFIFTHVCPRSG